MPTYGRYVTTKPKAGYRAANEVGPGDFIRVGQVWHKIESNPCHGKDELPLSWWIKTTRGLAYGNLAIDQYAKAKDLQHQ